MKKRLLFGLLVLTLIALPLCAACAEEPPQRLKIGVISVLSGGGALWGQAALNGIEMAVEEVNVDGVKIDGVTYRFDLIIEDDEYLADVGVDRARKLIERDGVQFVFGSIASAVNIAMGPVFAENQVLHLCSGAAKDVIGEGNTYTFSQAVIAQFKVPGLMEYLAEAYPNVSKVVSIYPDDETGLADDGVFREVAPDLGWETISEGYERGIIEFGPLCAKVANEKPDAVILNGPPPGDAKLIVKGLRDLGYDEPFGYVGVFPLVTLYEELGEDMGDVYEYAGVGEKPYCNDEYAEFYIDYVEKYGIEAWTDIATFFYSWFKIFVDAIDEAQSLDPTVIRDLLETPGKEWYHVIGGKCYMITDEIASAIGLGSNHYLNVAFQIAGWDSVAEKTVNVGWGYPYGWPGGELPE